MFNPTNKDLEALKKVGVTSLTHFGKNTDDNWLTSGREYFHMSFENYEEQLTYRTNQDVCVGYEKDMATEN